MGAQIVCPKCNNEGIELMECENCKTIGCHRCMKKSFKKWICHKCEMPKADDFAYFGGQTGESKQGEENIFSMFN